jgi:hypothetical protein
MNGSVADDRIRTLAVQSGVLLDEVRLGDHVVVEKQDHLVASQCGAVIARFRGATVGLLDDGERKRDVNSAKSCSRAVDRAVDDDDDFDVTRITDVSERLYRVAHDIAPLVCRNYD